MGVHNRPSNACWSGGKVPWISSQARVPTTQQRDNRNKFNQGMPFITWQNSTKECLLLLGKTQPRNAWSNYLVRLTRSFLASDRLSERSVSSSRLAPAAFEIWTIEYRQTHYLVILQIWNIFDTFLLKTSDEWCDWYEYTSINLNDDIVMKMKTYLLNKIEENWRFHCLIYWLQKIPLLPASEAPEVTRNIQLKCNLT